jgi:transitional endoplasmic reticulum ATPase
VKTGPPSSTGPGFGRPAPDSEGLQQLQAVIEDPESTHRFGVEPPSGLLLAGPPGTGKTTIAKILAAQARCSFYPISGADVLSTWVGESAGNIRRLFERARSNRPAIVFIDEIDAIAGRRGGVGAHDDPGQPSCWSRSTAWPDRPGCSSSAPPTVRTSWIPRCCAVAGCRAPSTSASRTSVAALAILRLHTARMPTVRVRLREVARMTDGFSPVDLKALCQEAAMAAMARRDRRQGRRPAASAPRP